jgi:hypothetical protein
MRFIFSIILLTFLFSCQREDTEVIPFKVVRYSVNGVENQNANGISLTPEIRVTFSQTVNKNTANEAIQLYSGADRTSIDLVWLPGDSTLVVRPEAALRELTVHDFIIDNRLATTSGEALQSALQTRFVTVMDTTNKLPLMSDEALLDLVQKQTFLYFWDFAHPGSGLARERNTSGDLVTSGGSGFGVMAIIAGIHRGFITREQGLERLLKITDFLLHKADRFHGAFPHWLHGSTGKTIPFSQKDNGGDIVETSFLIAGLLCASSYFDASLPEENRLRQQIKTIWEEVEWNWYTKGGNNVIYWHWSPNYQWEMNHQLKGWNEALITYVLAAASPTFPISKEIYEKGWASSGNMKNNRSFYSLNLPLGPDYGGPLFFSHYSFLGLDPRNLSDSYADYNTQVVNHSLINYNYCVANPRKFLGYGPQCWGLTASDTNIGYTAHSPTNDRGVISPTAALSSMPFTPDQSMAAMRFFYYKLGDRIFREYGFVDAFNLTNLWFADSFLAIDQGPIVIMIENHRSGLLWEYTMKHPDIRNGLDKLGFRY